VWQAGNSSHLSQPALLLHAKLHFEPSDDGQGAWSRDPNFQLKQARARHRSAGAAEPRQRALASPRDHLPAPTMVWLLPPPCFGIPVPALSWHHQAPGTGSPSRGTLPLSTAARSPAPGAAAGPAVGEGHQGRHDGQHPDRPFGQAGGAQHPGGTCTTPWGPEQPSRQGSRCGPSQPLLPAAERGLLPWTFQQHSGASKAEAPLHLKQELP